MTQFFILFESRFLTIDCVLKHGFWSNPLTHSGSFPPILPGHLDDASIYVLLLIWCGFLGANESFIHLGIFLGHDLSSGLTTICCERSLMIGLIADLLCSFTVHHVVPNSLFWTYKHYAVEMSVSLPGFVLH